MDYITRAMLGDHDAAARLTEQGALIPCRCGATPTLFGDKSTPAAQRIIA